MSKIDKFLRALKAKNNEYYTRYEDVKFFVENSLIKDYLKDKVVYLPCDTEESNIYKYLVDEKDNLGIKEILRTYDDYYGHLDLYEKCDVVFTNPPFTGIKKWLKWLDSIGKKYISWFPMMGLYSWPAIVCDKIIINAINREGMMSFTNTGIAIKEIHNKFICFATNGCGGLIDNENNEFTITNTDVACVDERKKCMFVNNEGKLKTVPIYIISNDDYFDNFEYVGAAFRKTFEEVKDKLFYVNDGYEVKQAPYIPNDYYGYLYVPITAYIGRWNYFEYYGVYDVVCKDVKARPRIKVKLKRNEEKAE